MLAPSPSAPPTAKQSSSSQNGAAAGSGKKRKRQSDHEASSRTTPKSELATGPDGQLVEQDVKIYVDNTYPQSWQVRSFKKKAKDPPIDALTHTSTFATRLNFQYYVEPSNAWAVLKSYKRFTLGDEANAVSFAIDDFIYVKNDDGADEDAATQWKAQVKGVKALDGEHVYITVAWLYRPEDLPQGRQSYHGQFELIPSNHLDVIDAMTVDAPLNLIQWDLDSDTKHKESQYYWRQTYDTVNGGQISRLENVCLEKKPYNPDDVMIQCTNKDCAKWMHATCLAAQAIPKDGMETHGKATKTKKNVMFPFKVVKRHEPGIVCTIKFEEYTAKLRYSDEKGRRQSAKADHETDTEYKIDVYSTTGEKQISLPVCLFCGEIVA